MGHERSDLAVKARVGFQMIAVPIEGADVCQKRAVRQFASHPRGALLFPRGLIHDSSRMWTDGDWAGDVASQQSCSGGDVFTSVEATVYIGAMPMHMLQHILAKLRLSVQRGVSRKVSAL